MIEKNEWVAALKTTMDRCAYSALTAMTPNSRYARTRGAACSVLEYSFFTSDMRQRLARSALYPSPPPPGAVVRRYEKGSWYSHVEDGFWP